MKKILASLLLCLMAALGAHAEKWVALTAANFPDAEFRNYLKRWSTTGSSGSKPVYNANMYNATTNMINVDAFSEVNINYKNGTVNNVKVTYTSIKSLEGIKLLRAVEKITLPNPGRQNVKCALTSLDVSGMPYLKTITNLAVESKGSFPIRQTISGQPSQR